MTAQASNRYILQEQYIILQRIRNCTLAGGRKDDKKTATPSHQIYPWNLSGSLKQTPCGISVSQLCW